MTRCTKIISKNNCWKNNSNEEGEGRETKKQRLLSKIVPSVTISDNEVQKADITINNDDPEFNSKHENVVFDLLHMIENDNGSSLQQYLERLAILQEKLNIADEEMEQILAQHNRENVFGDKEINNDEMVKKIDILNDYRVSSIKGAKPTDIDRNSNTEQRFFTLDELIKYLNVTGLLPTQIMELVENLTEATRNAQKENLTDPPSLDEGPDFE